MNGTGRQTFFTDITTDKRKQKTMRLNPASSLSFLTLTGLLLGSSAAAQVVPDAGTFIRELETQTPQQPEAGDPEAVLPEGQSASPEASGDGTRVLVERFELSGNRAVSTEVLRRQLAELEGEPLTLSQLQAAAGRITAYYREQGYFLARAYLPRQDVSDGTVTIDVLEGRLGGVELNNTSRTRDAVLMRPFRDLEADQMVVADELETPLLHLSDLPGIDVQTTLVPGSETGTSDLRVDVEQGDLINGTVELDNYGNRSIGEYRLGGSIRVNSPFGLGDRFELRGLLSDEEQVFFRARYQAPVGPWATQLGVAYSDMDYELGGNFDELGARGNARITTLFADQSIIRSRNHNLNVQFQYDSKDLEDRIDAFGADSDKDSELFTLTVGGDWRDQWLGGAVSRWSLAFTRGELDINSYQDRVIDAVTARTAGSFQRWTPSIMRLQNLGGDWSLHAQLHGQFANSNLDSSEKLSLGGAYGVRAYAQGEGIGDEGYIGNLELRYSLDSRWQLYALFDHGEVDINNTPWDDSDNSRELTGAGVGARLSSPDWHLNITAATPVGSEDTVVDDDDFRVFARAVWRF